MNKKMKTLLAATLISTATLTTYATATFAGQAQVKALQLTPTTQVIPAKRLKPANRTVRKVVRIVKIVKIIKQHRPAWRLGLRRNKHLSATDARTITKAALLMRGRKHLTVGKIQPLTTKRGRKAYLIQIVNKKNKVISSVILNSANGHIKPLRFMKKHGRHQF